MFEYTSWTDRFEVHQIGDGLGNFIRVVPERGGIVSEFVFNNEPVFFPGSRHVN